MGTLEKITAIAERTKALAGSDELKPAREAVEEIRAAMKRPAAKPLDPAAVYGRWNRAGG